MLDLTTTQHTCFPARRYFVIGGPAGSGKSRVLRYLQELGGQIVDIECLGRHYGSAFGERPGWEQPTQGVFVKSLEDCIIHSSPDRPVYVEHEGRFIGKLAIPKTLYEGWRQAPVFQLNVPTRLRLENLLADYGGLSTAALAERLARLQPQLEPKLYERGRAALQRGNALGFVKLMLEYYDGARAYAVAPGRVVGQVAVARGGYRAAAERIIALSGALIHSPDGRSPGL